MIRLLFYKIRKRVVPVFSRKRLPIVFTGLYKEVSSLFFILLYLFLLFKLTFYKESFSFIFLFIVKLFYLFVLPGYFLLLYKKEKICFSIRLISGMVLNVGILLILSYYLGILGIHIKYHAVILPSLVIGIGLLLYRYKEKVEAIRLFQNF